MDEKIVYSGKAPIEVERMIVGYADVVVKKSVSPHIQAGGLNPDILVAEATFKGKTYQAKSIRGGVDAAVEEVVTLIKKNLK